MFAPGFVTPLVQDEASIQLLQGYQDDTMTCFRFKRPLVASCSTTQQLSLSLTQPHWLIVALGDTNKWSKHAIGNVGQKVVDISTRFFDSVKPSRNKTTGKLVLKNENVTTLDLLSEPVTIPPQTTVYCYTYYSFEELEKMHIVAEEPLINRQVMRRINL
jgi:hypothetical protein